MGYVWAAVIALLAVILGILYFIEHQEPENQERNLRMAEAAEANIEKFKSQNMSAFVLGATGEVGKELIKALAASKVFQRVVLIGRRKVEYEDPELAQMEQKVVDFDKIEEHADAFSGLDVGFCCLGTTRGKSGADGFYKVDHDYVVNSAKVAKEAGCKDFHLTSSQGANAKASMLYTKTKGEVEEELKAMGFSHLFIYRPGVLLCNREESRKGEAVVRFLFKPIAAMFPTAASVPTSTVAQAMVNTAVAPDSPQVELIDNKAIHQRGKPPQSSK